MRETTDRRTAPLTEVYKGENCTLWRSGNTRQKREGLVCVSFSSRKLPRPELYGLGVFERMNVPVLYVQPHSNDWYQSRDVARILGRIRALVGDNDILTYGSSMGGFAALAFAKQLGATKAIAISPQVSISREIVGHFEPRWVEEASKVEFLYPDVRALYDGTVTQALVVYDPYHRLDRNHVDLICGESGQGLVRMPVPFAGHPASYALAFNSVLSMLLATALRGHDLAEVKTLAMQQYRRSPVRKYVIAIGIGIHARRTKRHRVWAERFRQRYRVDGLPMNLPSLRKLVQQPAAGSEAQNHPDLSSND